MNPLRAASRKLGRKLAEIEKAHEAPGWYSIFEDGVQAELKQELAQERDAKMKEEIRKFAGENG